MTALHEMLSCAEIRARIGGEGCCDSCHEDWNEGYEMCEEKTPWGDAHVCCRVANDLHDWTAALGAPRPTKEGSA